MRTPLPYAHLTAAAPAPAARGVAVPAAASAGAAPLIAAEPRTSCEIREVAEVNRAYKAILQRAAESAIDLIVMGTHGHASVEELLCGSNTQHVLRAATCPVLTVRA